MNTRKIAILIATAVALGWPAGPSLGAEPVRTLVLRQGEVPSLDGAPIPCAAVYTNTVDTYVDRLTPDTAYGDAEILHFFRHDRILLNTQTAWIRFDGFDSHLPPGAEIVAARLFLMGAGEEPPSVNPKSYGNVGVMLAAWGSNSTWTAPTTRDSSSGTAGVMRISCRSR